MKTRTRWWLGLAALALALLSLTLDSKNPRRASASPLARLFGPIASLVASVEWVRVDRALAVGREPLAYQRAERALRLEPGSPEGWSYLAHHWVFERASLEREPDPARRREWILAGLELLERGERESHSPAELAFDRGLILAFLASMEDADRAWPQEAQEALRLAREAFERAEALGHPHAREMRETLREEQGR